MSDPVASDGPAPVDGRSSRWDAHRAHRREQLIDAAIAAVNEFGTDVGMDQIAATARTSKPVIYRYFADKGDLHAAMGERIVGMIVRALRDVRDRGVRDRDVRDRDVRDRDGVRARDDAPGADPRRVLTASIDAYLQLLAVNPELFRFVTGDRAGDSRPGEPASADYSRPVATLLTDEFAALLRAAGLDTARARPYGEAVVGFITAASRWWIEHPQEMTRAELTEHLAALLWGGVAGLTGP